MSNPSIKMNVSDILLNTNNHRYIPGTLHNQQECIKAVLSDNKARIIVLAEDIAKYGLSFDPIIVFKLDDNSWTVLEGNRRVTALKLLNDPSLCADSRDKERLEKIKSEHLSTIPKAIDVIAATDKAAVDRYISRRHTGYNNGLGIADWGTQGKERYLEGHDGKLKYPLSYEVIMVLGIHNKSNFPVSTLERVLKTKGVIDALGLTKAGNGQLQGVSASHPVLSKIVDDLDKGSVNVSSLKNKNDIFNYLDNIGLKINSIKKLEKHVDKPVKVAQTISARADYMTGPSSKRNNLIFAGKKDNFVPKEKNMKAHDMYNELCTINVNKFPISVALTFRAFIEISVRYYAQENHIFLDKKTTSADGKVRSEQKKLAGIIEDVCKKMKEGGLISGDDKAGIINIGNKGVSTSDFNGYAHDKYALPSSELLNNTWVALEKMLRLCWKTQT